MQVRHDAAAPTWRRTTTCGRTRCSAAFTLSLAQLAILGAYWPPPVRFNLDLYKNYLIENPNSPKRGEIEKRITTLEKEMKHRSTATPAPVVPPIEPIPAPPAVVTPALEPSPTPGPEAAPPCRPLGSRESSEGGRHLDLTAGAPAAQPGSSRPGGGVREVHLGLAARPARVPLSPESPETRDTPGPCNPPRDTNSCIGIPLLATIRNRGPGKACSRRECRR